MQIKQTKSQSSHTCRSIASSTRSWFRARRFASLESQQTNRNPTRQRTNDTTKEWRHCAPVSTKRCVLGVAKASGARCIACGEATYCAERKKIKSITMAPWQRRKELRVRMNSSLIFRWKRLRLLPVGVTKKNKKKNSATVSFYPLVHVGCESVNILRKKKLQKIKK